MTRWKRPLLYQFFKAEGVEINRVVFIAPVGAVET